MDWSNPIVIGLILGIPSFMIGLLTYRRSTRVDENTESAVLVASRDNRVSQIIDGLNRLVENLQEDNKVWRESVTTITEKMSEVITELNKVIAERDACRRELDTCRAELDRMKQMLRSGSNDASS